MKTKILFGITKGVWGGAQEYVFSLATSLSPEKYDISVVIGGGETLAEKLAEKNIRLICVENLKRDISAMAEIKSFFSLWKIVHYERPDILHLNSSKMGLLGGLVGRLCGVPKIIFTAHGLASNENRPFLVRKFFLFLHWLTILLSHTTIAVSHKTKSDLDRLPFISQKIFVVHNGIRTNGRSLAVEKSAAKRQGNVGSGTIDFFDKDVARTVLATMSRVPLDINKIWIGTVSELHKNKGLDFLISACRDLPDNISILIIGEGDEKENLENQIKKLELQNKIHLLGRVENARKYLKAFDIFTLTSRTEALPYTVLEAGLAGLPVVASRVGGIPEIIENNKSGILVAPGDIVEISKSLKNLALEPQKCVSLGAVLREKVEREFSLEKMISETEKFYRPDADVA